MQFTQMLPPRRGIVGHGWEIAAHSRCLSIVIPIAPQLAVDRRVVPAEPFRDLRDGRLGLTQPKYQTPFIQGEVAVRRSHGKFLPKANVLKNLRSRVWTA